VAKQIPVKAGYDDALSPGMKQVGKFVEDLGKSIRLVGLPLQVLAFIQDRVEDLLSRSVHGISDENLVAPAPQIVVPVIEAARLEPSGSPIDEMFEALLNKSMDASRVHLAHPSYPVIIPQLSPDEARLLRVLHLAKQVGSYPSTIVKMDLDRSTGRLTWINVVVEKDELDRSIFDFPENYAYYQQHLYSMGMTVVVKVNDDFLYDNGPNNNQTGLRTTEEFQLTKFGELFMEAVTR